MQSFRAMLGGDKVARVVEKKTLQHQLRVAFVENVACPKCVPIERFMEMPGFFLSFPVKEPSS